MKISLASALALLIAAPGADAYSRLQVKSPGTDQLVRSESVSVTVRTAGSLKKFEARLNGRPLRRSFSAIGGNLRRATIPRSMLRSGPNHLEMTTKDSKGGRGFQTARFIAGTPSSSFLTLEAPSEGSSSIKVKASVAGNANLAFKARLNGRPVGGLFEAGRDGARRAWLGADDGLRFGRNELTVLAARRSGVYDQETRVIDVARDAPLVGAGKPVTTAGARKVKLRPVGSKRSLPGSEVTHSWEVIQAPGGSKAAVSSKGGSRASFKPDRVGTYRIRLTMSEGSDARSGSDVITVSNVANVPPIGMPIDTMAFNDVYQVPGADAGIRVGSTVYWLGNANLPQPEYTVKAVILNRTTLQVQFAKSYVGTAQDAQNLQQRIKKYGSDSIVIVSNTDIYSGGGTDAAFASVVKSLGGAPIANVANLDGGWSIVGVPGASNSAYESAGTNDFPGGVELRGKLTGYLQQGSFDKFTFVPGTRPSFDTAAFGAAPLQNTIRIGSQEYGSGPLANCGTGGFQVLVLAAETLAQVDSRTFTTNGCGGADPTNQTEMAGYLASIPNINSRGNKLVAVQSIGNARGPQDLNWIAVANAIATVGGTPATFAGAKGQYSLLGGVGGGPIPITEQSSSLTGSPGTISGVLKQNRQGSYRPSGSLPGPLSTYSLSAIAYQAGQEWPFSQSQAEKSALAYIAGELSEFPGPTPSNSCYVPTTPDVRSEYCNLSLVDDWGTYSSDVLKIPFTGGKGFTAQDLSNVATELSKEFLIVSQVWPTISALKQPFGTASEKAQVDLNSIATHIKTDLKAPNGAKVAGAWTTLVGDLLNLSAFFTPEAAAAVVGVEGASLDVAGDATGLINGSPVLDTFSIKVQDLANDLANSYNAASSQLDQVGALLVTDYGKLTAFAANPNFEVSSQTIRNNTSTISANSRGFVYQELVSAAYEAFQLEPTASLNDPLPTNANSYRCSLPLNEGGSPYNAFKASSGAQYYLTDFGVPELLVMVVAGADPPDVAPSDAGDPVPSPPGPIIDAAFEDPGLGKGGAGQFRPWFWRQALGFGSPGSNIDTVTCRGS